MLNLSPSNEVTAVKSLCDRISLISVLWEKLLFYFEERVRERFKVSLEKKKQKRRKHMVRGFEKEGRGKALLLKD